VWIAAHMVYKLPIPYVRWLVVIVVLYAAFTMLRSAAQRAPQLRSAESAG
jgi:uncharacterized membrane protein YfcA